MIQVVMFDLGGTLIDANRLPFPDVAEALTAIGRQHTKTCLVSDFIEGLSPDEAMTQYLAILETAGLRSFFEPVEERVTLSNHAGVGKPDALIFSKALERLRAAAVPFADCLLITEDARHIRTVSRVLKMKTLQFGADFTDWADAPSRISALAAEADTK